MRERARRTARRYGLAAKGAAAAALVAVAVIAVVAGSALRSSEPLTIERAEEVAVPDAGTRETVPDDAEEPEAPLVVHVDGAVASPDVYELEPGSRVADAIDAAGGLAEGADTSTLNLAAPVADGEKVHVPVEGESAPAAPGTSGGAEAGGLVNLNTAGVEELDELPGVGEATAQAIVEDREANGPFTTVEDLMRVSGIGEKKFERLRELVCV